MTAVGRGLQLPPTTLALTVQDPAEHRYAVNGKVRFLGNTEHTLALGYGMFTDVSNAQCVREMTLRWTLQG